MDRKNYLAGMPPEIMTNIYLLLPDLGSVISLTKTSKIFYAVLDSTEQTRTAIFQSAMETQFDPLPELYKLARVRGLDLFKPEIEVPKLNLPTIKLMTSYGKVVQKWVDFYPQMCWIENTDDRRILYPNEQSVLRATIYRWWMYSGCFHQEAVLQRLGYNIQVDDQDDDRLKFLRQFKPSEINELIELTACLEAYNLFRLHDHRIILHELRALYPAEFEKLDPNELPTEFVSPNDPRYDPELSREYNDYADANFDDDLWTEAEPRGEDFDPFTAEYMVRGNLKFNPDKLYHFFMLQNRAQRKKFLFVTGDLRDHPAERTHWTLRIALAALCKETGWKACSLDRSKGFIVDSDVQLDVKSM